MTGILLLLGLGALAAAMGAGDDSAAANDVMHGEGEGTSGNDTMVGTDGADDIFGRLGDDELWGEAGNDLLKGGHGNDTLSGYLGDDDLRGGAGDDVLAANDGQDLLNGGAGNDLLSGGTGDDTLAGDDGSDYLLGDGGNDSLFGEQGDDFMAGGDGSDVMYGGEGNDIIEGYYNPMSAADGLFRDTDVRGADSLLGELGDDTLIAGSADTLTGGAGADTFRLGTWIGDPVTVTDYDPAEDQLQIIYEAAAGQPVVTVQQQGSSTNAEVLIDGQVAAIVEGAHGQLTAGDVFFLANPTWG